MYTQELITEFHLGKRDEKPHEHMEVSVPLGETSWQTGSYEQALKNKRKCFAEYSCIFCGIPEYMSPNICHRIFH